MFLDGGGQESSGIYGTEAWSFRTVDATSPAPETTSSSEGSNASEQSSAAQAQTTKDAIVTSETNSAGQTVTVVSLTEDSMKQAAESQQENKIVIDASGNGSNVQVNLPLSALNNVRDDTTLSFKSGQAEYNMPVSLIQQLSASTENAVLSVTIRNADTTTGSSVNSVAADENVTQLLSSPIDFVITVSGHEVTDFNGTYVERKLQVNQSLSTDEVTAVWYDPQTDTMNYVPATIENDNGRSIVTLKSNHNSVYTIVSSHKTFVDMQQHWAKDDVETMANKLIVKGVDAHDFAPDRPITRAEFTSLIVRGLGLKEASEKAAFSDVGKSDWYAGAIGAAVKAGLISGYEDGTFKPNQFITREDIALISERAARYADPTSHTASSNNTSSEFKDFETVDSWAQQATEIIVESRIMQGVTPNTLAPKQNATRAQATTILRRLLKFIKFMN
jgi:hypothetical protein